MVLRYYINGHWILSHPSALVHKNAVTQVCNTVFCLRSFCSKYILHIFLSSLHNFKEAKSYKIALYHQHDKLGQPNTWRTFSQRQKFVYHITLSNTAFFSMKQNLTQSMALRKFLTHALSMESFHAPVLHSNLIILLRRLILLWELNVLHAQFLDLRKLWKT